MLDNYFLANTTYPGVIIRSRYAEDALKAATQRGTRQYVLIGAGFDSFSLRLPAFANGLEIFEIDHPATQALKIERIKECGITLPASVHFIAADLANETLASALARSSFRSDEPAFFSWLGVTVYLTREANMATLRAVATSSAAGSELVFTYVDLAEFAEGGRRAPDHPYAQAVARLGEPFVSGFDPLEIASDLKSAGLELVEDLDGHQMAERYGRTGQALVHLPPCTSRWRAGREGISSLRGVKRRSNPESQRKLDCFVAEPVIGRAFARPVGSSQ